MRKLSKAEAIGQAPNGARKLAYFCGFDGSTIALTKLWMAPEYPQV